HRPGTRPRKVPPDRPRNPDLPLPRPLRRRRQPREVPHQGRGRGVQAQPRPHHPLPPAARTRGPDRRGRLRTHAGRRPRGGRCLHPLRRRVALPLPRGDLHRRLCHGRPRHQPGAARPVLLQSRSPPLTVTSAVFNPSRPPRTARRPDAVNPPDPTFPFPMRVLTYRQVLNEAFIEELERDPNVVIIGEEVAEYNGAYKVTEGLF